MARLELVEPDFARSLQQRDPRELRQIAALAADHALERFPIDDSRVSNAREKLRRGETGAGIERDQLMTLVEEFDELGFDLGDTLDADGQGANREAYLEAYYRARAAHALWFALDDDPVLAALDALYEAEAATRRMADLKALTEKVGD